MESKFRNIKKIAVTNRHLCYACYREMGLIKDGETACDCLLDLFKKLAKSDDYDTIILREKDMDEAEYEQLAVAAYDICKQYGKELVIHNFPRVAEKLGCAIHLPFQLFAQGCGEKVVGTSVHSVEDALYAESHGASYVIAGHIFETDCKKGLQGRGLDWLTSVCRAVSIPVYAIGGITEENTPDVIACGVSGYCMMSSVLDCV